MVATAACMQSLLDSLSLTMGARSRSCDGRLDWWAASPSSPARGCGLLLRPRDQGPTSHCIIPRADKHQPLNADRTLDGAIVLTFLCEYSQSKLSQEQLQELQNSTHFDKKELQQWYKGAFISCLAQAAEPLGFMSDSQSIIPVPSGPD